ncbi:hypothetical protein BHM03_00012018 [Ensete ventricosum]|nr:hypothetical protein BHM03_00012018 [Ensete ventricosum]
MADDHKGEADSRGTRTSRGEVLSETRDSRLGPPHVRLILPATRSWAQSKARFASQSSAIIYKSSFTHSYRPGNGCSVTGSKLYLQIRSKGKNCEEHL